MDSKTLQRRSKQGTIISILGFLIIIAIFIFAAVKLSDLTNKIEIKSDEINSLDSIKQALDMEIKVKKELISSLIEEEFNIAEDFKIKPKTRAVVIPGLYNTDKRQQYEFSLWLTSSYQTIGKIKSVSYIFPPNSFNIKTLESSEPSNGFLVNYRGWDCLEKVNINILYLDGNIETMSFNMCDSLEYNVRQSSKEELRDTYRERFKEGFKRESKIDLKKAN